MSQEPPLLPRLRAKLQHLQEIGQWRQPRLPAGAVDFTSNDYLGLARDGNLRAQVLAAAADFPLGSTGSRLLTGHLALAAQVEEALAAHFCAGAALLFTSGYSANLGLLGSLFTQGEQVWFDDRVHASMREGLKLSPATTHAFPHNNVEALRAGIRKHGATGIVVESLYSMDGDAAPLQELAAIAREAGAVLLVDEAHAAGVLGPQGAGLVVDAGLDEGAAFGRVVTFGKAFGGLGAAVLGPPLLREWLVNRARSQIYTTAPPPPQLLHTLHALPRLAAADEARAHIQHLQAALAGSGHPQVRSGPGAIAAWHQPGNYQVLAAAQQAQHAGYDVRPIRKPTVPAGTERIRICLHSYNTPEELQGLLAVLHQAAESAPAW